MHIYWNQQIIFAIDVDSKPALTYDLSLVDKYELKYLNLLLIHSIHHVQKTEGNRGCSSTWLSWLQVMDQARSQRVLGAGVARLLLLPAATPTHHPAPRPASSHPASPPRPSPPSRPPRHLDPASSGPPCCPLLPAGDLDDLYAFDPATMNWALLSAADYANSPSARASHGFTSVKGLVYVHGGSRSYGEAGQGGKGYGGQGRAGWEVDTKETGEVTLAFKVSLWCMLQIHVGWSIVWFF